MPRPKIITGRKLAEALRDAGIVGDLDRVSRIEIDISAATAAVEIRVHHWGDERLLTLVPALAEAEEEVPADG